LGVAGGGDLGRTTAGAAFGVGCGSCGGIGGVGTGGLPGLTPNARTMSVYLSLGAKRGKGDDNWDNGVDDAAEVNEVAEGAGMAEGAVEAEEGDGEGVNGVADGGGGVGGEGEGADDLISAKAEAPLEEGGGGGLASRLARGCALVCALANASS
jgi:hypothetical protein